MSYLANGVSIRITVSFTLAIVSTIETTIAKISTVSNSSVARNKPMAIVYSSYNTICSAMSYLANGVSIRITVSFALAIVSTIQTITSIASIANTSDDPRVVSMTSSNGIVKGQSIGYLADCVGISISISLRLTVSFTLAIETTIDTITSITSIANTSDDTRV